MSHGCTLDSSDCLHPVSHAAAVGEPVSPRASRIRLPGLKGKSIRLHNLALWMSIAVHAAVIGVFCTARLAEEIPAPPTLVEVEFVEIPGPKGGGGSPTKQPAVVNRALAPAPAPRAVPVPDRLAQAAVPQTVVPAPAAASSSVAAQPDGVPGGSDTGRGSGGGSGGGQGTGVGTSTGSGTGQGGIAVDRMPSPLRQVKPRYPLSARRMGKSGQVLLRLYVDVDGAVGEVNVVRAEPAGVFENAAVEAVRKWRFTPAMSRGVAVGMWMTLPVRFTLEDR